MHIEEKIKKYIKVISERVKKVKKRTLYCIGIGCILAILSFLINDESIYIRPYEIERADYGMTKTPYRISLDAHNLAKNLDFTIAVSSKKYTKKEADRVFKEKLEKLKVNMLNENIDYEHINSALSFPSNLGDGIRATYSFEPYLVKESTISEATKSNVDQFTYFVKYQNLINSLGEVNNDDFKINETCDGYISIELSTEIKEKEGTYRSDKVLIPVKVVSKNLTAIESFKNSFKKEIIKSDSDTIEKDTIRLPKKVNGFNIHYKDKRNFSFLFMPLLGFLFAILLEAKDKEKIKEEMKLRIRNLEIDFTQIISKILLYVNSGMTIRNSMIRLAEEYYSKLKKQRIKNRVAYDELLIVRNKLIGGYSEIKAYEEMAKNINLRTYTRFMNIVIQSIKNGNKDLRNILNMEVQDALYERKQKARKMGEEASTKLVLPLMMMLAVIMVVIMVPAFMGM